MLLHLPCGDLVYLLHCAVLKYLFDDYSLCYLLVFIYSVIHSPTSLSLYILPPSAISSVTIPASRLAFTASRIMAPSSLRLKLYSNISAAERIIARGFAISFPAAWGYEP